MVDKSKDKNTKVLVGNLPISVTEADLLELFSQANGTVVAVSLQLDPKGRNVGHAFVEMASREEALAAVELLSEAEFGGRSLNVSIADQPQDKSGPAKKKWFQFG